MPQPHIRRAGPRAMDVPQSLTAFALASIRSAIVSGRLRFGEPLSEVEIGSALGISKAPVRAALMELRGLGLVQIVPQAGTFVVAPTLEDVARLVELRSVLEVAAIHSAMDVAAGALCAALDESDEKLAAAYAAEDWEAFKYHDTGFHNAIIDNCGNRYLVAAYRGISGLVEALRARRTDIGPEVCERSLREHVQMTADLRAGRVAKATFILERHILRAKSLNMEALTMPPAPLSRSEVRQNRNYSEIFGKASSLS